MESKPMNDFVLEIKNLVKDFPGVRAVNDVSFNIKRNTVHCLVGENGAGKSTLIKILTGAYSRSGGEIFLNEKPYTANSPKEAGLLGISTLFQELNVVEQLSVEENLTLGVEDTKYGILIKSNKIKKRLEVLKDIDPTINPKARVSTLSVAKKQIIEIAKAVASDSDIIIMDEPTAALSESEIARLFKIIKRLRDKNVTVIYISHRLDEIFELGDFVTVMRDGKHIETKPLCEVKDRSELIKMMIGKEIIETYIPKDNQSDEVILEVKNVSNHKLKDISFTAKKGEIIGFYGLVGAGKTELARAIYGVDPYEGEILFRGKKMLQNTFKAIEAGIALVPEERRSQGIFTLLTIKRNIPVMNLKKISRHGIVDAAKEKEASEEYIKKLSIRTDTMEKETSKLSGGNQQKVVFAKCLFADADLLILDEPTRGIDVGAKSEIYQIVRNLSIAGKTILLFSSELPEILSQCDRIFLLYEGYERMEIKNGTSELNSEKIIHIVTGGM
jgi:ribose transport system ATP-binding protein